VIDIYIITNKHSRRLDKEKGLVVLDAKIVETRREFAVAS
jgi:hypothetical protein